MKNSRDRNKNKTAYFFLSGYLIFFIAFIVIPVVLAFILSFTHFNAIQTPEFVGIQNYINLFTKDREFMQYVIPNTIQFALFVGVGGYAISFVIAWLLAQLPKVPRTILAIIMYSPSLTQGVTMAVIWKSIFSGDSYGFVNSILLNLGIIQTPIQFLTSPDYLMTIMIIVAIWSSMGIGFLAMLAGVLNVDAQLYEAGAIDGIKSRVQEVFYITIPSMRPQMLFGAVMAVVNTFNVSAIGVQLSGQNPTPRYAGQLIVTHIEDFGFIRYEMGYAAALSVVLLLFVYGLSRAAFRLFAEKE